MNVLYPSYKTGLLAKTADWLSDSIRVALWDRDALYDPEHTNISELAGVEVAPGDNDIAGKSAVDGFAIGLPTEYLDLISPRRVSVAIMYRITDGELVAYMDDVYGFEFNPQGSGYALSPGGPGGAYFAL